MTSASPTRVHRPGALLILALALLYLAQGIPFGLASEYLPVVLRRAGYSRMQLALVFYLQLPWQLKILWARVADHPAVRPHARGVLLALQSLLALSIAAYALFDLQRAASAWFVLTALCALLAATQDIFVDALAVRSLTAGERGFGNVAQVAGYRLGMLVGGAGLLVGAQAIGTRAMLVACGALVAAVGAGVFVLREREEVPALEAVPEGVGGYREAKLAAREASLGFAGMMKHLVSPGARRVLALALTYKLGIHAAAALITPLVVDAGWTDAQIGYVKVTLGLLCGLAGSALGGVLHRAVRERGALEIAAAMQAVTCGVLALVALGHVPYLATVVAISLEHLASGLGTTVLFAALMTATRRADAALHYTALTTANAAAIGAGSFLGSALADALGAFPALVIATVIAFLPFALLRTWERDAALSAGSAPAPAATQ